VEEQVGTDGVHAAHCCVRHGCKYAHRDDADCPVVEGRVKQEHPCEFCDMDDEDAAPVIAQVVSWLEARIADLDAQAAEIKGTSSGALYSKDAVKRRADHYRDVVRGLREGAWKA
jgi:hypothetical protein